MEEQLIAAVYKRKAIWDPTDELRKNSKILKALWADIARDVGVDVNTAKNKWKNLRAYFLAQHRELDKPRYGCIKTTSSWCFYNQLLFLKDVMMLPDDAREDSLASARVSHFLEQTHVEETYDDSDVNNYFLGSFAENDTGAVYEIADTPVTSTKERPHNKGATNRRAGNKIDLRKRRSNINKRKLNADPQGHKGTNSGEMLDMPIERMKVELLERGISAEDHPDLLFFKSLIPYMQEFAPTQKLRIRSKIQNVILSELEAMHHGSGMTSDFMSTETGITALYDQSQHYRSPSASSLTADSV